MARPLASEYSDPTVILQHIPVLKDNLMLQQNPEYILYGLGGIIVSLFVLKRMKKRAKSRIKSVAMVMPQPYLGEADHPHSHETAPASFDASNLDPEPVRTPLRLEKREARSDTEVRQPTRNTQHSTLNKARARRLNNFKTSAESHLQHVPH